MSPTITDYAEALQVYADTKKLSTQAQVAEGQARARLLLCKRALDSEREDLLAL